MLPLTFIEQIVPDEETARSRALSMFPNLIGRTKIGLTAPSVDLLPPGAWPKRPSYTIDVNRTRYPDDGSRPMSAAALIGRRSEVPKWVKNWSDYREDGDSEQSSKFTLTTNWERSAVPSAEAR